MPFVAGRAVPDQMGSEFAGQHADPPDALPPIAGVGVTAVAMAQERASESARCDAIVTEPWAGAMVGAALSGLPPSPLRTQLANGATLGDIIAGMAGYVPLRTRWIDDCLQDAVAAGATQIVLVGAGLDTRALRLPWPRAVTLFSLDQPAVVALTERVLAGTSADDSVRWTLLPVDLSDHRWQEALRAAGFIGGVPTVWVMEGLLMYLPHAQVDDLMDRVLAMAGPDSTLLADLAHPSVHDGHLFAEGRRSLEANGSPLHSAVADPVAWYKAHGWDGRAADPVALAGRYERQVPAVLDQDRLGGPIFWLTKATFPRQGRWETDSSS